MRRFVLTTCLLAALPLAPAVAASPDDDAALGGDFIMVGVGLATLPDYEGSDDQRIVPVPGAIGKLGGISFQAVGNRASVDVIPEKPGARWDFQLGPVASLGFNRARLKGIADPRIRALGRQGYAVELGGQVGIARNGLITSAYDRLSVSVSYRKDVAGANNGAMIQPSISYLTPLSRKAMIIIFGQATHMDRRYAQSYFSISPTQSAASGLPTFDAQPGWKSASAGAAANISLTGDLTHGLSMIGGVMYMKLLNSAAATPMTSIAGNRNQWLGGLGLAYTF